MNTSNAPDSRSLTSPSAEEHRAAAPDSIRCAILTVSDTHTTETDTSGALIRQLLADAGHSVESYSVVVDDPDRIRAIVKQLINDDGIQAILTNGGTGIASRDTSYEAIAGLLEKRLDGFGELFRMLSYQEIGAAAMLSRAVAGISGRTVIVAMPGSKNAVQLAMERLVIPELGHLVFETAK
jgi:molybdenum cofactor biosynthesis protein B